MLEAVGWLSRPYKKTTPVNPRHAPNMHTPAYMHTLPRHLNSCTHAGKLPRTSAHAHTSTHALPALRFYEEAVAANGRDKLCYSLLSDGEALTIRRMTSISQWSAGTSVIYIYSSPLNAHGLHRPLVVASQAKSERQYVQGGKAPPAVMEQLRPATVWDITMELEGIADILTRSGVQRNRRLMARSRLAGKSAWTADKANREVALGDTFSQRQTWKSACLPKEVIRYRKKNESEQAGKRVRFTTRIASR